MKKPILIFQLPEILQTIEKLENQTDMPCFNPENVVFVTNKWDLVKQQIDSSDEDNSGSDEEKEPEIWEKLKMDIKQNWPSVREENIFKMVLKEVSIYFKFLLNSLPSKTLVNDIV